MTALPWDRFSPTQPEQPAPVPVPKPTPAPAPELPPGPSLQLGDALDTLWPAIKDMLTGYARSTWDGVRAGHTVDVLHPQITATDVSGRELVIADARNRSWRTFLQGLAFDLFAGLIAAIATLTGADPFQTETWIGFGVLLLKTLVSAGLSYLMRLRATPTIRTKGPEIALMPLPRPVSEDETNERMPA